MGRPRSGDVVRRLRAISRPQSPAASVTRVSMHACATVLLAAGMVLSASISAAFAAPVYSYFPTGVQNDGKMLVVAGTGLSTLSDYKVTLSFSVDNSMSQYKIGFFDGASDTTWDMSNNAFPTQYTLYADPLGDGTGTTVISQWTDTQMAGNAWSDFAVNTSAAAKAPSGNYFYRLVVAATTPNVSAMNGFKMRVEGYTYIIPTTLFGYIGAIPSDQSIVYPNYPTLTPTTYNGTWDFYMQVAQNTDHIDIWDGDFDAAGDTNDGSTTYTPTFDPGSAVTEGALPGNPLDDSGTSAYLRTPNVRYTVYAPNGASFANTNPSGNTEWELFRLSTLTSDTAVTDYRAVSLPAGMYNVKATGVDMHNLNALRFEHPLIGVDASGRPMPPPAPFLIGDRVWNDLDHDGVQDTGEPGMAGVIVSLRDPASGSIIANTMTDASGAYSLNSWDGTYRVVIDDLNYQPGGPLSLYSATNPDPASRTVNVANANVTDADFGFRLTPLQGLLISPDQTGSIAPGQSISYAYTVYNNTEATGTVSLSATSTLGWGPLIRNAAGSIVGAVTLRSGESTRVVVTLAAPAGATIGTQDTMKLTGALVASPTVTATARGVTKVLAGLRIAPSRASDGAPLTSVAYRHTVTNSWSTTRTIALSATSSRGWTTAIFDADGVTPLTSADIGPGGATRDIVVKVAVPSGTSSGTVDVMTVTAAAGGSPVTVTDTTTVRLLDVYPDNAYSTPVEVYQSGDSIYARAAGLQTNKNHYFVWTDPDGTIVRSSTSARPSSAGVAVDTYATSGTDVTGRWTVTCYRTTATLTSTTQFTLTSKTDIAALYATNASRIGTNVSVASTLHNANAAAVINSTATYTIWWDSDGDGAFDNGDLYITPAGAPATWNGSTPVSTHVSTGLDVQGTGYLADPTWSISNAAFPNQGTYSVTETWSSSGGTVLDAKTTQFFSVPTLGEWMATVAQSGTRSLPPILLGGALWLALTFWLYRTRRWLRMYLTGAFGFVMFVLFFSQALGWDTALEALEARNALFIASWLQMRLELLGTSGLAIRNHVGWGVFDIGIECSALLEMAAFAGLVAFYPGFRSGRKGWTLVIGLIATYSINIARILIIVGMVAMLGTSWVFIAHAVVGRVFFFIGIVIVYWYLMTRPSVRAVGVKLESGAGQGDSRG